MLTCYKFAIRGCRNGGKALFPPRKYEGRVARTIVFGHTHSPNYFRFGEGELSDMTFVNSGSWVRPDNAADKKTADVPYNTTVYVDSKRPILFKWDDELRTLKAMEQSPLRPRFEHKRV